MTVSQDSSAPLVVVGAATSRQGSSVIKHLIESNVPYRLRGFTRYASRPAAVALSKQGVDIVQTSLTVNDSVAVRKAFEGATYVFAVTDFWSHLDMQREIAEGEMLVDAANAAKVKLLVWSSLPNTTKLSGGKYTNVYHFDSKAEVTDYAKKIGVPFVEVQCGWYVENFKNLNMFSKQADGTILLESPNNLDTVYPFIHTASDFGLFVKMAIESGDIVSGSSVQAYGELVTGAQLIAQFAKVTGKQLVYKQIAGEEFVRRVNVKLPIENAQEMLEMFLFVQDFGYYGTNDLKSFEGLATHTWADYVEATDWNEL